MVEFAQIVTPWDNLRALAWHPILSGQSGAMVWRGELDGTPVAVLKQYPTAMTIQRLKSIHSVMALAYTSLGLPIPNVIKSKSGESLHVHDGHLCDVQTWMNGQQGSTQDVAAGLQAIRQLHQAIGQQHTQIRPAPGTEARCNVLNQWNIPKALSTLRELTPWLGVTRRCHTIHGDLHREHLLFQNGQAAGFIDFAATRIDDPLLDVARWLGEVGLPEHLQLWGEDEALLSVLVQASLLCSLRRWHATPTAPRAVFLKQCLQLWMPD
jgi:Ser/Thr protein kinase RdoA (MazF antagonist)